MKEEGNVGRIIAIANQKGGVGKTTTAINLSACLAEAGQKVLVIDIDPQGNTTSGFGLSKTEIEKTVYEVILRECDIKEAIQEQVIENLDILPSNVNLAGAEIDLIDVENKKKLNPELELEGVVFTMYDSRTNLSLQVVENVKDNLKQNIYKTIIPRNIRLAEAPSHGLPINLYDPKSTGAESYRLLAEEVMGREE